VASLIQKTNIMKAKIYLTTILLAFATYLFAQEAKIEVVGDADEYVRVHSTPQTGGLAGIELLIGNSGGILSGDWRIINDQGTMRFVSTNDNFSTLGSPRMTLQRFGDVGIGITNPESTLHIGSGGEASNTDDGYLIIGDKGGFNLVFDNNELNSRNNGIASSLYLQRHGGHLFVGSAGGNSYLSHGGGSTYTGFNGGNTYLSYGGGNVSIGNAPIITKLNVVDDGYQFHLRNAQDGINDWYIGASSAAWAAGDNQLLFSPSNSSTAAILRLKDVTDNNGTDAPVVIASSGGSRLLMDGNEIDANSPLFINHNTNENTYINPTGGKVAVGSTSPWGMLHVELPGNSGECLSLESPQCSWSITPSTVGTNENLFFRPSTEPFAIAGISSVNGAWLAFSDRRFKENIEYLPSIIDKVNQLGLYSYTIKSDENKTPNIGVIAQEVQEYFPELVSHLEDRLAVNYGQLSVVALKAIQELSDENDELKSKVQHQQEELQQLQLKVDQLIQLHQK
jgi:hypothetical protein